MAEGRGADNSGIEAAGFAGVLDDHSARWLSEVDGAGSNLRGAPTWSAFASGAVAVDELRVGTAGVTGSLSPISRDGSSGTALVGARRGRDFDGAEVTRSSESAAADDPPRPAPVRVRAFVADLSAVFSALEAVEPAEPAVSAYATAGIDATAAPTPSATASAPTRPT
jgi:hypothetical protein